MEEYYFIGGNVFSIHRPDLFLGFAVTAFFHKKFLRASTIVQHDKSTMLEVHRLVLGEHLKCEKMVSDREWRLCSTYDSNQKTMDNDSTAAGIWTASAITSYVSEDGKRIKLKDLFVEWDTKTMHDLEKMPLGQDWMLMVASYNLLLMRAARGASGAPVPSNPPLLL